jgi:hypothetical protein
MPSKRTHLPDPYTALHRRREFAPIDKKHIPREEIIKQIDKYHRGTNPKLMGRAVRAPEVIEKKAKRAGLNEKEILKKQEQIVSRIASKYVDHLISGLKEKKIIDAKITPEKERQLWIQSYNEFVENFFTKTKPKIRIEKGKKKFVWESIGEKDSAILNTRLKIVNEMDRAINYVLPPKFVIKRRKKDQKYFLKSLRLIKEGKNPEQNLQEEVERILNRRYSLPGRKYSTQQVKRAKALHVALAVSIYADMLERTCAENWVTAYTDGMLQIEKIIGKRPDIEKEIIDLDKINV